MSAAKENMTTQKQDENFLSRWSQRKRAVASGEEIQDVASLPEAGALEKEGISEERQAELDDNRAAAEAVDIDSLNYDSDFSVFLKDGVPSLLRQKAMRLLWRSNPILANVDGLCDYDDNFADPSMILKKFESAYRIGKGYLFEEKTEEEDEEEPTLTNLDAASEEDDAALPEEDVEPEKLQSVRLDEKEEAGSSIFEQDQADAEDLINEASDLQMEEVAVERPRVSLRQRLQFDS